MSRPNHFVAAAGMIAALAATAPAFAKGRPVPVPSSMLTDDNARLCMPKSTLPTPTKDQPATICQTVGEWKAQGVKFVAM